MGQYLFFGVLFICLFIAEAFGQTPIFSATKPVYSFHGVGTRNGVLGRRITILSTISSTGTANAKNVGICGTQGSTTRNLPLWQNEKIYTTGKVVAPTTILEPGTYTFWTCLEVSSGWKTISETLTVTVTAPSANSSPSGLNIPTTNPSGFSSVFSDNFPGTSIGAGWGEPYRSKPDPERTTDHKWLRNHVRVHNGKMQFLGYEEDGDYATGGIMNSLGQTYGKYELRIRMDKGNGVKHVALLWPVGDNWYQGGEIDITEDAGGIRNTSTGNVHWFPNKDDTIHEQRQRTVMLDLSTWHTMGAEWVPGKVTFLIDNLPFGVVSDSSVPNGPMRFAIQTHAKTTCGRFPYTCVDSTTPKNVTLEVDWVRIYKRN